MMLRKTALLADENYHIYNRGAHKQAIFRCEDDYNRFFALLHLSNHKNPIVLRDLLEKQKYRGRFSVDIFTEHADKSLVDLLAYSLMPNHFHLILRQKVEQGISTFMKKLSVGYSMYFNLKHEHDGTLFQGRFKSSHLNSNPYFKWIFSYVHLNPVAIVDPGWKDNKIANAKRVNDFLGKYQYSSYFDYYIAERPHRAILAYDEALNFIDKKEDVAGLIADYEHGRELYRDETTGVGSLGYWG